MVKQPMGNVEQLSQDLQSEWSKPDPDLTKCGDLLNRLKLVITQLACLPLEGKGPVNKHEAILARSVLETGAFYSIRMQDVPSFERYIAQLKVYFFDMRASLEESEHRGELLGLNLLGLLSQNRIADFHTELELLPGSELSSSYIAFPIHLEQYLIEGNYSKILHARSLAPAESYLFFIDILSNTVREEIASCCEKAFEKIPVTELRKILFLDNDDDAMKIAEKHKWKMSAGAYWFPGPTKAADAIPASKLVGQALAYARELEKIV